MGDAALLFALDAPPDLPAEELIELLGGKAAGLVGMTALGLPVPPGFTLTTDGCRAVRSEGWTDAHDDAVARAVATLEASCGRRLGDATSPLLVSVRSGSRLSMPGMMDTVLDVGCTPAVIEALADLSGDADFAADTARRAVRSFQTVVGTDPPADPLAQVTAAMRAVCASWDSARAHHYRTREGISHDGGTAVTVQAMVFGNLGTDSGSGVAFSRDPSTGAPGPVGDFLINAQGEDVVAGTHRTLDLSIVGDRWPVLGAELDRVLGVLEHHVGDMVDVEFTIERGELFLLQARRGKRSPRAACRIAVDLTADPSFDVDRAEAVRRCQPHLASPPTIASGSDDDDAGRAAVVIASGLGASPGRGIGVLCVDIDDAIDRAQRGEPVVLVRHETSPSDVHAMSVAAGLVTRRGGLVSHAAVVARAWGIPAVVGADDLTIDADRVTGPNGTFEVGETVTVDGDAGRLLLGEVAPSRKVVPAATTLLAWAHELGLA